MTELPVITRNTAARQKRGAREEGQNRGAFDAELTSLGLTPRSKVTVQTDVPPSADIAQLLGLAEGATVLVRQREMFANEIPVTLSTSYIPWDAAEGTRLAEEDTGPGGVYSRLAELGHSPVEFAETVRVRPPTDEEAQALRMDLDQRVYDITRTARTSEGAVIEVNNIVMPSHQWELTFTWSAEE